MKILLDYFFNVHLWLLSLILSKSNFNNIKYKLKYVYDDCLSLINIIKQLGEQNIDDFDEENNDDSSSSSAFGSFDMDEPFVTPLIKAFAKALGEYVEKKKK